MLPSASAWTLKETAVSAAEVTSSDIPMNVEIPVDYYNTNRLS